MFKTLKKPELLILKAFAVLAFSVPTLASESQEQPTRIEKALLKFNKTGKTDRCLSTHRIRNIRAPDDKHLIIRYSANVSYLSKLPTRCPGLGFHESIAYKSFANRVCKSDRFRVINSNRFLGASCGFGEFEKLKRKPRSE